MSQLSYGTIFFSQMRKELRQHGRRMGPAVTPLLFFAVVVSLFPLSTEPSPQRLAMIAGPVVWVAALLAAMLAQQTLFRGEFDDGSLQLMALSPAPLWLQILAKQTTHWLVSGLPLVVLSPLAAYSMNLPADGYTTLMLSLLLGTLSLSALGALGAALTVSIGQGGLLFAVLVLPLVVPVLIMGTQATELASNGNSAAGALNILVAYSTLCLTLTPFATAAAIRVSLD
ncbi:MAG: heme exporter protein CcmB [Gammaproteobacteria bacterium]